MTQATTDGPEPSEPFSNTDEVRKALEAAGLHTWELGDGIVNVHSTPVTSDGSDDAKSYLFTVTVTTTP